MNLKANRELADRLAGEYVLGTLRGPARERFRSMLAEDASLRQIVDAWQARLSPLAAGVPPVDPPSRVWRTLQRRIAALQRPASSGPWWAGLAFWRAWGMAATVCTLALLAFTLLTRPEVSTPPPAYIATLRDDHGAPLFVAYARRDSTELWVERVAMKQVEPEHSYELWGLYDRPGAAPRSLGVVPIAPRGAMRLPAAAGAALAEFPRLAITVEAPGGSKTSAPQGPIVCAGENRAFW